MTTLHARDADILDAERSCADPADLLPERGVLALGEPTHGSGNAFAWKWQVILDLAKRGLISTLAFEESFAVGLAVDASLRQEPDAGVLAAESASRSALDDAWDRASSIWDTRDVRAGLHALQTLNRSLPPERRIRFLGIDVRKPHEAARQLLSRGYDDAVLVNVAERRCLGEDEPEQMLAAAGRISSQAKSSSSARFPDDEGATGLLLARQITRYVETYLLQPDFAGLHLRERCMADTLLENLPAVGGTVLWAHNEHVGRAEDAFGEAASAGSSFSTATPSMGWFLAEHLGPRYAPVGVLCTTGECRAVDPATGEAGFRSVSLPPIRPGTTEHAFAELPRGFHRTRDLPSHPGPRRFVGWQLDSNLASSDPGAFEIQRPTSDFDALELLGPSIAAT